MAMVDRERGAVEVGQVWEWNATRSWWRVVVVRHGDLTSKIHVMLRALSNGTERVETLGGLIAGYKLLPPSPRTHRGGRDG